MGIPGILATPDYTLKDSASGSILAQMEVKGSNTNLRRGIKESALQKTWWYMTNTAHADYGICTNYDEFILVSRNETIHNTQSFRFSDIEDDEDDLREFIWLFHDIVVERSVDEHHAHSIQHDKDLTDVFYDMYHNTRLMLIQEFVESFRDIDQAVARRRALALAQTFLNRLLFIFFAEDMDLANTQLQKRILRTAKNAADHSSKVCAEILDMFDAYDNGSDDLGICDFNGRLFSEKQDRNVAFADKRPDGYWTADLAKVKETGGILPGVGGLSGIVRNIIRMSRYNFKTDINVEILGQIFERSISDIGRLKQTSDDERKRGGIYYTPPKITAKICRQTILPYLSVSGTAETVDDVLTEHMDDLSGLERRLDSIKILDPACGSGAFLVGAVDILLDVHRALYDELKKRNIASLEPWIKEAKAGEIIRSNICGVDLNGESVGITKLALFLKTARKGQKLPDLDDTVKQGNSLIRDKEVVSDAFDWDAEFPDQAETGGFDVIIGNPPYVRQESLAHKDAMQLPRPNDLGLRDHAITPAADLYVYFMYHSLNLLKRGGRLGFITSDSWLFVNYAKDIQRTVTTHAKIHSLERPDGAVFADPDVRTVMSFLERTDDTQDGHVVKFASGPDYEPRPVRQVDVRPGRWLRHFGSASLKTDVKMVNLQKVARVWRGITTGRNEFFVLDTETVQRYGISDKYLTAALKKNVVGAVLRHAAAHYLLTVSDSKGVLAGSPDGGPVMEYLKLGDEKAYPKKGKDMRPTRIRDMPSVKAHKPHWYTLRMPPPPPIVISRIVDKRLRVYENERGLVPVNNFACAAPYDIGHTHALLAYLSSSWFALQSENGGRAAGGGALYFAISDFKQMPVPDFSSMDYSPLGEAWLQYREDLDLERLDAAVFAFLGVGGDQAEAIRVRLAETIRQRKTAAKP